MVEPESQDLGVKRFGAYLRKVREGKKLSLDSVEEMSAGFPERITKSHLSRIENGLAIPTFPRLMALGEIYGTPMSVLAERFEIETREDPSAAEYAALGDLQLVEECRKAHVAGRFRTCLAIYSILQDRRLAGPMKPDLARKLLELQIQRIDALIQLEHFETGKVECEQLLNASNLDARLRIHVLHLFSVASRKLGRLAVALMGLDQAAKEAASIPDVPPKVAGDLAMLRANLLKDSNRPDEALPHYREALERYEAIGDQLDATMTRVNLADALILLDRLAEARKVAGESLDVARERGYERQQAVLLSHLAAIEFKNGKMREAEGYCIRSNAIARQLGHTSVVFRNCYYLMKIYRSSNDDAGAKVNERTLKAYVGRVDDTLPEAQAFRAELAGGGA